jgi:hypothetical protein
MRWLPPSLLLVPFLVACVGSTPPPCPKAPEPPPASAVPASAAQGAACPGKVEAIDGLAPADDDALYKQALGQPGKGSLCTGQVFEVLRPVKVYRVWTKEKSHTKLGRWWSFSRPRGPVSEYRRANAICAEWSDLDVVSECTLKAGARVVVGPGQSALCKAESYPVSETNQVFVPNDTRDPEKQKVLVEGCTEGSPFP